MTSITRIPASPTSSLLKLRDALTLESRAARAQVINVVKKFFYYHLTPLPAIKEYMSSFAQAA